MNLNKVLLNVVVAAAVSAVTAAGTSYLLFRYATPFGYAPGPGDPAPVELKGTNIHWSAKLNYSFTL